MGQLVADSRPVVAALRPQTLGFVGFQVVLLLLQQSRKYKVVHTLHYLIDFNSEVRPNGNSSRVSGMCVQQFQEVTKNQQKITQTSLLRRSHVYVVCSSELHVSPANSSRNETVKWCLHWQYR
jgi:hypothetical protein